MSRPRSVANAEGETEVPLSHISQFNLSPSEGSRSNGTKSCTCTAYVTQLAERMCTLRWTYRDVNMDWTFRSWKQRTCTILLTIVWCTVFVSQKMKSILSIFLYTCWFFYWFVKSNKIPKKWFHVWFIIYLSKIICLRICGIELQGICATTKADKKKTHWAFRLIRVLLSCHGVTL